MDYRKASKETLQAELAALQARYEACKARGLKLDMSRGKPSKAQLDLCQGLLTAVTDGAQLQGQQGDLRNYGVLDGAVECRRLFAELLEVPVENVIAGGNASLTMMYDTLLRLWIFGAPGVEQPWCRQPGVKWLCPVPGYDRHFAICQQLGIEMLPVPMLEDGPDMDLVEALVRDPAVKGIWCVPRYSNPEGKVYSDAVVRRFAALKPAAEDFRIFWDNAYAVHHLTEDPQPLLNIFDACREQGSEDMVLIYTSTSKISYAGAGVACMAASDRNVAWTKKLMGVQMISADKVNQMRHVLYFKDAAGVHAHMQKHAALLRPKFQLVLQRLEAELAGTGAGSWHKPQGGYFVSFDAMPGCAGRIHALCKDAGLVLTGAGATFPYGRDPQDSNLRIAPSLPPLEELEQAMEVFCICARLAAVERCLEQ